MCDVDLGTHPMPKREGGHVRHAIAIDEEVRSKERRNRSAEPVLPGYTTGSVWNAADAAVTHAHRMLAGGGVTCSTTRFEFEATSPCVLSAQARNSNVPMFANLSLFNFDSSVCKDSLCFRRQKPSFQ